MSRTLRTFIAPVAVVAVFIASPVSAQHDHHHEGSSSHTGRFHFSHPLITESPSPDTKVRLDYAHELFDEEVPGTSNAIALEAEYAFVPQFSVEFSLPYVFIDPTRGPAVSNLSDIEIGLKFATFALEEQGLLVGGGIEFGIPTGNAAKNIGGEHFEIEPFVNVAFQRERFEAVVFAIVGIPTEREEGEPLETEFASNVSFLYHALPALQALLEFDASAPLNHGDEEVVAHLAPGLKVRPLSSIPSLFIGLGYRIPVTAHKEFDSHTRVSMFYHF